MTDVRDPDVSAVVLAYGAEPWLERCVGAILASEGVSAEVVLVDNGCTDGAVDRLDGMAGVTVVRPGRNLGFAGGCNVGAASARGDVLALVNADAIVEPGALARLREVASRPGVGIATGSIRLADDPDRLNSAGNPLHFLGVVWAGALGDPAVAHAFEKEVATASGAGLALRRAVWGGLGGFAPEYFSYLEDAELSWRVWQRGLRVVYVPQAVVVHRYEFSRNPHKLYLLARNRLLLLWTAYEWRTLVLLGPALALFELALLALAARQGWWRGHLAAWGWNMRHLGWVRRRRRLLQGERRVPDRALAPLLADRLDPRAFPLPSGTRVLDAALAAYWRGVRRLL